MTLRTNSTSLTVKGSKGGMRLEPGPRLKEEAQSQGDVIINMSLPDIGQSGSKTPKLESLLPQGVSRHPSASVALMTFLHKLLLFLGGTGGSVRNSTYYRLPRNYAKYQLSPRSPY